LQATLRWWPPRWRRPADRGVFASIYQFNLSGYGAMLEAAHSVICEHAPR